MKAVVIKYPIEWETFSSFKKIAHVLSYCCRWRKTKPEGVLTVEVLNETKHFSKRCQKENFHGAYEEESFHDANFI